jgi:hypothetical protein
MQTYAKRPVWKCSGLNPRIFRPRIQNFSSLSAETAKKPTDRQTVGGTVSIEHILFKMNTQYFLFCQFWANYIWEICTLKVLVSIPLCKNWIKEIKRTPKNKICWPEKFGPLSQKTHGFWDNGPKIFETDFSVVSTDLVHCLKNLMVFETTDQKFLRQQFLRSSQQINLFEEPFSVGWSGNHIFRCKRSRVLSSIKQIM